MAYDVNNIIPIILNITPAGLGYANFASGLIFARPQDLASGVSFDVDSYRDYGGLSELAQEFDEESDTYLIASRWFANLPTPRSLTVWMWDENADSPIDVSTKVANEIFRFFHFWPASLAQADWLALADWSDANERYLMVPTSDPQVVDPQVETDLGSMLLAKGNRMVSVAYQPADIVANDPSQIYAGVQLAAAFYKFRPAGLRTAITGEYQVLPGVVGADLRTTEYNALKAKKVIFFTKIELKGQTDNSRVINSWSMSSYGEFMDDVVNLAVLKNYLQVDGYNYIANAGTKRPLTPTGYAGLLATLETTSKMFYDNGVLGDGTYNDPVTGEEQIAQKGYVIHGQPEDVYELTPAQRRNREFPTTNMTAILARAGHTAEIIVNVE
ncbi:FIG01221327: hypothetical protein [Alloalcanivorax xenomutans]|uniref:DUF3383 family protein n=1 Tax=Alloalcanivorax xenomutans TaxID=1094342 RepID=UPI0006D5BBEB|nr:DUF3383 family protein [Alloalcanivorax xenomutans]CUR48493.1 FIG01221327: hypothetical protein [Alloalcanivorax xenomutans]